MSDRHYRALEALYASAPVNSAFASTLEIVEEGRARIHFDVTSAMFHAAGAAHGTIYFKMLDDAAFYAANSLVTDMFVLTTAFNLFLTRPVPEGPLIAEGRWVSGQRRVLIAESWLTDADGEEVGRGTGTFMRSRIPLASLPAYAARFGGMTPRLTAQLWVNALIRRVNAAGGFATVLTKGDAIAGGVILLLASHDQPTRVLQRVSAADGGFVWQQALSVAKECTTDIEDYLARQHRRDSDLWILELDIPSPERFIAEPILAG